jgi:AI-2 transport protein TqsA
VSAADALPPPPTPDKALGRLQAGVTVIAVILVGVTLHLLRHILTPLALAIFLLLMIDGLSGAITARIKGFPTRLATPLSIVLVVGVFVLAIWLVADNGADFASQSQAYTTKLNAMLQQGSARLGLATTPTVSSLFAEVNPGRIVGVAAKGLRVVAESAIFVLIYLGFLLASRSGFRTKGEEMFRGEASRREALRVFRRIRRGVESYIWVQTVVGAMITAASAVIMAVMGLSHIPFWCFIIFLANYIPAIGGAIGVILPPLFGLVDFNDYLRPVVMVALLEAVHFVVNHVVQPRMQGKNLNLDPIVVLLALAFWGMMWGVTGAFLSTPLTVVAMAILAEFPATRPIAVLLSSDGKPYADDVTKTAGG